MLFKGSYGATGAALPGLLESMVFGASSSPPRVVGFRGTRQLLSSPPPLTEEAGEDGEEEEYENDAAEGPDIDDVRPIGHVRGQPFTPPFSQTQHHAQGSDRDTCRSFAAGGWKQSAKPRAQSNMTPSWLPSDDWVRPGSRISGQSKRPTTSSSTTSNTGFVSSEENTRPPPPPPSSSRGQMRLSALGTLPLRNMTDADTQGVKRTNDSSMRSKELATSSSSGREESDPAAVAVRLRKEAKLRKREEEAKMIREKRMTRAFGGARNDEDALAALQEQEGDEEMETRGRTRVRVPKGNKSVMIPS